MTCGSITSWQIEGGKVEAVTDYFLRLQNHCRRMSAAAMKLKKMLVPRKKSYDKPKQCIKKQIHHFTLQRSEQSKLWFLQ